MDKRIFLFSSFFLLLLVSNVNATWNSSFIYSTTITSNQAPNRNESITFYMSEISGWNRNQVLANCNDIRIVNASDNEQLDYFVDICNSTDVRIGFLNKYNVSGVIAKVYWNYSEAEAQNKSMRLFYDDFNTGTVLNPLKWSKNSACDATVSVGGGIVQIVNNGANTNCVYFWYKNSTTLQNEIVYAKVNFTTDAGSTGVGLGVLNSTSNNERLLCRRYDDSSKVAIDNENIANGAGVSISGLAKNTWFWARAYQSGSNTLGKVWVITNNEPSADTNSEAYASRIGYFGLAPATAPAYVQSYDDFQIWNNQYPPIMYATSSTLTLASVPLASTPIPIKQWLEFTWFNETHVNLTLSVWVFNNQTKTVNNLVIDVFNFTDYTISSLTSGAENTTSETKRFIRPAVDTMDLWFNVTGANITGGTSTLYNITGTSNVVKSIIPIDPVVKSGAYRGGNWVVDCSKNFVVTKSFDLGGNSLITTGSGTLTLKNIITSVGNFFISNACQLLINSQVG